MMITARIFKGTVILIAGCVLAPACSDGKTTATSGDLEGTTDPPHSIEQPLKGGTITSVLRSVVWVTPGCGGMVVGPRHVLTAKHCVRHNPDGIPGISEGIIQKDNLSGIGIFLGNFARVYSHPLVDAAVIVADRDLGLEPIRVYEGPMSNWAGRRVFAVGFGGGVRADGTSGGSAGAWMTINGDTDARGDRYNMGTSAEGAAICSGDSGGPDLAWMGGYWHVVGVHATGDCTIGGNSVKAERFADWVRSLVPLQESVGHVPPARLLSTSPALKRDSVGNTNQEDWIVTTPTGLQTMRWNGSSFVATWTSPNTSEWTIGHIQADLADFNGDQRADLLTLTRSQLAIYLSTGSGFNTASPFFTRTLQRGVDKVFIGDFNFDGKPDLLTQDWNSTYYFEGTGSGFRPLVYVYNTLTPPTNPIGQSMPYTHTVLTLGDFNGDGATDFIAQDDFGGTLFTGTPGSIAASTGPFSLFGLETLDTTRTWKRGVTHLVVANLVNDAASPGADLIASSSSGTQIWGSSNTCGPCNFKTIPWLRTDLKPGDTGLFIGDYNADGNDDMLIANPSGAYLYQGTGLWNAPFVQNVWTSTIPIQTTRFEFGRMDANAAEDLWITRPEASYGYFGRTTGSPFDVNQWANSSRNLMDFALRQGL